MAISKGRQFEILRELLAEVDELRFVDLDRAAERHGLTRDALFTVVEPLLYLEFFPGDGANPITWMHELEYEDGVLSRGIGAEHDGVPVRTLETQPPDHDTALDLYLSASIMNSLEPNPTLASALGRLAEVVRVTLIAPLEQPPALGVVQQAWNEQRSVVVKYLADGAEAAVAKEILPWRIFANWGRWYVKGTSTEHGEERTYRVDRMVDARLGDTPVERTEHQPIPEWFSMEHNVRSVRVRMPADLEPSLATPIRFSDRTALPDGREEVTITVNGDPRLEHLLVSLPPDAEVLEPAEFAERRRAHAARLLADYA